MIRIFLFVVATMVVYIGGFVYEQVGPVFFTVVVTVIASIPMLFKIAFWKKVIFMVPLLVVRVVGKIFLTVFGKNALSKLLTKYGLLERRLNHVVETFAQSKNKGITQWQRMPRSTQAYLLLIFFPVALGIFVLALIIKIVRLRFLQFIVEKLMQSYLIKWTSIAQSKFVGSKFQSAKHEAMKANDSKEKQPGSAKDKMADKDNGRSGKR